MLCRRGENGGLQRGFVGVRKGMMYVLEARRQGVSAREQKRGGGYDQQKQKPREMAATTTRGGR